MRSSTGYVSVDLASPSSYVSVEGASPSSRRSSSAGSRAADPASRAWSLLAFVVKSAVAVLASVASVALTIGVWQLAARSPLTRTAPSAAVPPLRPAEGPSVIAEGASLIEVVSSDDRTVVELRPLDEVHRQALTHRGVWVFVVNVAGQVLLLRRPATMMTCPETWSVVGEHNKPGESYLQAGRRGVAEELGWSLEQVAGMDITLLGAPTFFEQRYPGAARSGAVARTDRQHSAYTLLRLTLTLTLTLTQTLTQTLPLTLTLTLPLPLTFTLAQTLTLTLARYALLRLPASGAPPMSPTGDEVSARRWVPLKRLAGEVALGGAQFCTERTRKRVFEEGLHRVCAALARGICGVGGVAAPAAG